MPIVERCQNCGNRVTAPDAFAGQDVPCPGCSAAVHLPAAVLDIEDLQPVAFAASSAATVANSEQKVGQKVLVRCDECFQPYLVEPSAVDLEFDCPKCQHTFSVSAEALHLSSDKSQLQRNLKAATSTSPTLGDELLVDLESLEQSAGRGAPLRSSDRLTWVPATIRHRVASLLRLVEDHPIRLLAIVITATAFLLAIAYVLP